jgi:hypothetical protein
VHTKSDALRWYGIFRAFPLLCVFVFRIAIPKEAVMTDWGGPKRGMQLTVSEPVVFVWFVGRCHRSSASSYWRRGLLTVGPTENLYEGVGTLTSKAPSLS